MIVVEFCIGCSDASDVEMAVAVAAVAEVLLGKSAMFGGGWGLVVLGF